MGTLIPRKLACLHCEGRRRKRKRKREKKKRKEVLMKTSTQYENLTSKSSSKGGVSFMEGGQAVAQPWRKERKRQESISKRKRGFQSRTHNLDILITPRTKGRGEKPSSKLPVSQKGETTMSDLLARGKGTEGMRRRGKKEKKFRGPNDF